MDLCTAALTACQSQDRKALHLPTQLKQLKAKIPPTDTEQSGAITTMRRDSTALTIEALEDGLSYRLTPELFGMTPPNIRINLQGLDQSGSYIAFPEEPEINFNGEPSAVLTLDVSFTRMNNHAMQIRLTSTRGRDELVHLSVSHYTLSSGYWLYELNSAS